MLRKLLMLGGCRAGLLACWPASQTFVVSSASRPLHSYQCNLAAFVPFVSAAVERPGFEGCLYLLTVDARFVCR